MYPLIYACICLFVIHYHKFLYMKLCWTNKGCLWNEKESDFNAKFEYWEKHQWKLLIFRVFDHFASSPTNYRLLTLIWSIAAKKSRRKFKELLKLHVSKIGFIYQLFTGILHVMFTVQFTAVNNSLGQRIILRVIFAVFEWNNLLYIDSKLILRILNYEITG